MQQTFAGFKMNNLPFVKGYLRIFCLVICWQVLSVAKGRAQIAEGVTLIHQWNDTEHVVLNRIGQRYSDVWGFVQGGQEYAVIGSTMGAHIIDVNTGKQVAFAAGADSGAGIIHRDYKTYKHYLYAVCDEGQSNLQIFDLNYLPDSLHLVYESDKNDFMLAHNAFVDTAKGKLYVCPVRGLQSQISRMRVYGLSNPEKPVLQAIYNNEYSVHDVYVRNDTAFCSTEYQGYKVVDFSSNDQNYVTIGELTDYPYKGYNHSSWINNSGIGVMADETHGLPLKVIDARDVTDIKVLSHFAPRDEESCIPHNPYLIGHYVFVSYYFDGLQIYDLSDPKNPKRAGYYDTYPLPNFVGFAGAWGCYPFLPSKKVLVSDMQTGLYILDVSGAVPADSVIETKPAFSVYPNPARGSIKVRLEEDMAGATEFALYDLSGRLVCQQPAEWKAGSIVVELTLSPCLSAGTYVLKAKGPRSVHTAKILVY